MQSAQPESHAKPHEPPAQVGVAWGGVGQTIVHEPQTAGFASTFVSHPFRSGTPVIRSQLSHPGTQLAGAQVPVAQVGVACAIAHVVPQPPQLDTTSRLCSQPLP